MKRILTLLLIAVLTVSGLSAQMFEPAKPEVLASIYLQSELKGVEDVTAGQIKKLVPIVLCIDKEYPFLTDFTVHGKKEMARKHMAILTLKEKLYPQVLTKEQMEQLQPEFDKLKKQFLDVLENSEKRRRKDK